MTSYSVHLHSVGQTNMKISERFYFFGHNINIFSLFVWVFFFLVFFRVDVSNILTLNNTALSAAATIAR